MRTIQLSLFATGLVALAVTARPAAQVLSSSEVGQAIEHRQPADHAKLQAHFAELSVRYAADAERHQAFARSAGATRGAGVAAARHHQRLAELATESSRITSELSMHHQALAAGQPSTAPKGGEPFEAGAGAPAIPSE
jgi:hypothetical protein